MDNLTLDVISNEVKAVVEEKLTPVFTKELTDQVKTDIDKHVKEFAENSYKDDFKKKVDSTTRTTNNEIEAKCKRSTIKLQKEFEKHQNYLNDLKDAVHKATKQASEDLDKDYNSYADALEDQYQNSLAAMEDATGENIENIIDATNNHLDQTINSKKTEHTQPKRETTWTKGDEVAFVDEFTGMTCNVKINEAHTHTINQYSAQLNSRMENRKQSQLHN